MFVGDVMVWLGEKLVLQHLFSVLATAYVYIFDEVCKTAHPDSANERTDSVCFFLGNAVGIMKNGMGCLESHVSQFAGFMKDQAVEEHRSCGVFPSPSLIWRSA